MDDLVLQMNAVSKVFTAKMGGLTILNDLNFSLKRGVIAGIVSPSGTGKTTLLQIAGLMDVPDSGEVLIGGIAMQNLSDRKRAKVRCKNIGYVYQQHHLLPEFTALENVTMPLLISGVRTKKAEERATEILSEMLLGERLSHKPSALSGGEQQRVAIARAIVTRPQILLADEPTGNLDPATSKYVFDNMLNSLRKRGGGALIVTHNHHLASALDELYELENGTLVPLDRKKLIAEIKARLPVQKTIVKTTVARNLMQSSKHNPLK